MQRRIPRWLVVLGVILGCLIALLLAARLTVDPNAFKPRLAALVARVSGLEPVFNGDVSLSLFPFGLRFEDFSLAVPEAAVADGAQTPPQLPLLRASSLSVAVSPLALLQGELLAHSLTLEGAEVVLVRGVAGDFNLPSPPVREMEADAEAVTVTTSQGETLRFGYGITELRVRDGKVLLRDEATGQSWTLTGVELQAEGITPTAAFPVSLACRVESGAPALTGTLRMQGRLTADPVRRLVSLSEQQLQAELQGAALPVEALRLSLSGGGAALDGQAHSLRLEGLEAELRGSGGSLSQEQTVRLVWEGGRLDMAQGTLEAAPLRLSGPDFAATVTLSGEGLPTTPLLTLGVDIPAAPLRVIMARLGLSAPSTPDPEALQRVGVQAQGTLRPERWELSSARLLLDNTVLELAAQWQPEARTGSLDLRCTDLHLDRYWPLQAGEQQEAKAAEATAPAGQPAGVEAFRLPPAWGEVGLVAELHCSNLRAAKLLFPSLEARVELDKGQAQSVLRLEKFYQGEATLRGQADLREAEPPLTLQGTAKGVQLEPLLRDLTGKAVLSGPAALELDLQARGLGDAALRRSLSGPFSLQAGPGALLGYSVTPTALQGGGNTAYQSLRARGTAREGRLHLSELSGRFAPHSVQGGGQVDLVQETLALELKAQFLGLAALPVSVSGPWRKPAVSVDATGLLQGGVEALGGVLQVPEKAGETAGEALGRALQLPQQGGKGLKNVLEGLIR